MENRHERRKKRSIQRREQKQARKAALKAQRAKNKAQRNEKADLVVLKRTPSMQRLIPRSEVRSIVEVRDRLQREVANLRTEVIVLRDKVKQYEGKLPTIALPHSA